jgi:hypothetical protein
VVVVEDQDERLVARRDLIEERRADKLGTRVRSGTEQAFRRFHCTWPDGAQGPAEVANEASQIVVGRVD